jgi:predicted CoA-binding protein
VAAIVDEAIRLGVPALWFQEGVVDPAAATRARDAGIFTVMDRCMFKARRALDA